MTEWENIVAFQLFNTGVVTPSEYITAVQDPLKKTNSRFAVRFYKYTSYWMVPANQPKVSLSC